MQVLKYKNYKMKKAFIAVLILLFANPLTAQIFELKQPEPIDSTSAYANEYLKIKQLYVERLNSQSYMDMLEAQHDFLDKIKVKTDEYLGSFEKIMEFISDNIEDTDFKNFEEANHLLKAWQEKSDIELKENKEFHDYLVKVLVKFGGEFYLGLKDEMRREYPEKF